MNSETPNNLLDETSDETLDSRLKESIDFEKYFNAVVSCNPVRPEGRVSQVIGLIAQGDSLGLGVGSLCSLINDRNEEIKAEVIGFKNEKALLMPYGDIRGISSGSRIVPISKSPDVEVGDGFLGRVIDGMGNPIDGKGEIDFSCRYPLYGKPLNPMDRKPIKQPLDVGVAAINTMMTLGRGQRVAIMAGSGVGKSILMGMITKHTEADVVVIGLVGERGREVKDFINNILQEQGLKRSVLVAATSDSPPLIRIRGAYLATTIAEYFRDQGKHVNLMMDSVTRLAMAQREIGLSLGEPPTTKGYTPSVFSMLPRLLERAGTSAGRGTITGLYTVLVEGDDMNEPIADAVRSILDGHIVLTRDLANQNHYPAIDILRSISRVMEDIADTDHKHHAGRIKDVLATYRKAEDLINIGAYAAGSNPKIDLAIRMIDPINRYLRQGIQEKASFAESVDALTAMQN